MELSSEQLKRIAELGVSTVYEAAGRVGLIDLPLRPLKPGSRIAGPALPVMCGQDDNLMVHACVEHVQPGDVVVLAMPEPRPVALVGDLLLTQLAYRGAAAVLVLAAVRDVVELERSEPPVWTRYVRSTGATKDKSGTVGEEVLVAGTRIRRGDVVVLDDDGAVVVDQERALAVLDASEQRFSKEERSRAAYVSGVLSVDLNGLRGLYSD